MTNLSIAEYALLSDCRSASLVSRGGWSSAGSGDGSRSDLYAVRVVVQIVPGDRDGRIQADAESVRHVDARAGGAHGVAADENVAVAAGRHRSGAAFIAGLVSVALSI